MGRDVIFAVQRCLPASGKTAGEDKAQPGFVCADAGINFSAI